MKEPVTIRSAGPEVTQADVEGMIHVLYELRASHWVPEKSIPAVIAMHPVKWHNMSRLVYKSESASMCRVIRQTPEGDTYFLGIRVLKSTDLLENIIMLF